ncbi:hypothetical protein C8J57DRAFT_1247811 [Mycena rebaudengoi]|nr:hypothetical protein C8J57DRAFT_1247811 [Mycena rebaudengoi]
MPKCLENFRKLPQEGFPDAGDRDTGPGVVVVLHRKGVTGECGHRDAAPWREEEKPRETVLSVLRTPIGGLYGWVSGCSVGQARCGVSVVSSASESVKLAHGGDSVHKTPPETEGRTGKSRGEGIRDGVPMAMRDCDMKRVNGDDVEGEKGEKGCMRVGREEHSGGEGRGQGEMDGWMGDEGERETEEFTYSHCVPPGTSRKRAPSASPPKFPSTTRRIFSARSPPFSRKTRRGARAAGGSSVLVSTSVGARTASFSALSSVLDGEEDADYEDEAGDVDADAEETKNESEADCGLSVAVEEADNARRTIQVLKYAYVVSCDWYPGRQSRCRGPEVLVNFCKPLTKRKAGPESKCNLNPVLREAVNAPHDSQEATKRSRAVVAGGKICVARVDRSPGPGDQAIHRFGLRFEYSQEIGKKQANLFTNKYAFKRIRAPLPTYCLWRRSQMLWAIYRSITGAYSFSMGLILLQLDLQKTFKFGMRSAYFKLNPHLVDLHFRTMANREVGR